MVHGPWNRRRLSTRTSWLAASSWLILAVGAVTTLALPGPPDGVPVRTALVVTLAVFFASLLGRLVLVAPRDPRRRGALLFLAGAVALWALGSASVSAAMTVGVVTFPAPGEILCLASYLGMAAFLLLDVRRLPATTVAIWLEAAVVCGAAVCLAAFAVLTPLAGRFAEGGVALLLAVLFPLINLLLAGITLAQLSLRVRVPSRSAAALVVGFVGLAVADSNFIVSSSGGRYSSSIGLDAIWGVSFAAIVGAACARPPSDAVGPIQRPHGVVLVVGVGLAVVVLVLDLTGFVGLVIKGFALLTLLSAGALLVRALQEARGAAEAMRLSLTDELTGLPNRRALMTASDEELRQGRPVGIMLLDIDGFKDVNDSLGHAVGDDVLISIGRRIRAVLDAKSMVARLGGDEFAVLSSDDDALGLFETACEIRSAVRAPLRVEGIDLSLDASIGITACDTEQATSADLLRRADIAMYEAKASRVGVLLFDSSQDGFARRRLQRGDELRRGIMADELVVWYQPQIDARTRQVVAMEALVRWSHPTEGLLSPIAFLTDARRSGLMPALTEVVMLQVIADARRWATAGFEFRVAMNWAPAELMSDQLLPKLFEMLDRADLPADRLVVEVTEDSFLSDPERARMVLHELRAHGLQVSIDDYGTGFSSLAYLRDLPVQELKMDRSFISDIATDERSQMIVRTTTQMARALGLRLVAEGVEDQQAAALLLPLGVDVLQGYHISRPMPAQAVDPWVRDWALRTAIVPQARLGGDR
ncbi:MAG TPA: EAL domain-containing protein [Cellulomonas sp.]|uniref:putative bifunctional diguanylate cyclase/phosphodiesterase n=1 Tax=Cellulomonas sp. TaxID=40001 RepID=UPI002E35FA45|nr:EAL domain-containing protein [Cellulomonas sp.]HEX5331477.1 EAL domain-containing protein [Cellulomonas sp.]